MWMKVFQGKGKRILALILAVCIFATMTPVETFAAPREGEPIALGVFPIHLQVENENGTSEDKGSVAFSEVSKIQTVEYGQKLNFSLPQYNAEWYQIYGADQDSYYVDPKFTYLSGYDPAKANNLDDVTWSQLEQDTKLLPGFYYIGYAFTDTQGKSFSRLTSENGIRVEAVQLASPTGAHWENGSTAVWDPVTTDLNGNTIDTTAEYKVTLCKADTTKRGTPRVVESFVIDPKGLDVPSVDLTEEIMKEGAGCYTFAVEAMPGNSHPAVDCYNMSVAANSDSGTSDKGPAYAYAVQTSVLEGVGIASVGIEGQESQKTKLLIFGNSAYDSMTIHAELEPGNEMGEWMVSPANSIEIGESSTDTGLVTVTAGLKNGVDYTDLTEIQITANAKDVTPPVISGFTAGTGEQYGKLLGTAVDQETGIAAYAFSSATEKEGIPESDWRTEETPKAGETESYASGVTAGGDYYFYVKDTNGNVTRSESPSISATELKFEEYYEGGIRTEHSEILIGPEERTIADGARAGYVFLGWYEDPECAGEKVTEAAAESGKPERTLYGSWKRLDSQHSRRDVIRHMTAQNRN